MPSLLSIRWPLPFIVAALLACSGSVEAPGGGGAGGSGAAGGGSSVGASSSQGSSGIAMTSASQSASSGGPDDCGTLGTIYTDALTEARKCNACIDFDGCINGPVFPDLCGCPVGLDGSKGEANAKVKEAFVNWKNAGCMPFECGQPCFAGSGFSCAPVDGTCDGQCTPF